MKRVALLDLFAQKGGFLGDAALGALGAALVDRGHEVELVRSVLAEEPGADAEAWHARLASLVRRGRFDLVVLPRAWDPATIDALRAALAEGAALVRLTNGVAARLDDRFDRVLDPAGLLALAGGAADVPAAAFKRTTARELRALPLAPLAVPIEATNARGDDVLGSRPTLSGPSSGCPFLLDAAKSPLFADLGMDPDAIQTKGCTFCLDNTGAFVVRTEAEVLAAWLPQLRRLRGKNKSPGVREILLTDERPHPYLPALFRAVRDEGLGPIELMMKSRVDWLLEFADGPMSEAAAIAAESGSVLHVYLVGFESFDPFHLQLFNKGVTVEDNLRAIDALRALAARFPASFEHTKYRAHGIVLFTPWTRPEHLLENARVMRAVRFHELRAEAVRTRLRLYPRVPLHALAARDGLLVDRFEDGRGDRAAEQGYDASVPWRFQDARTEAIYRVATGLSRYDRTLADADVIEAATRFVLRYPGLARVPDVAYVPMDQAVRIWLPSPDGAETRTAGFDPEVDLVAAGVRRAALKEGVPSAAAEGLVRAYRAMGLAASVVVRHGLSAAVDTHEPGDAFAIVAVAADEATLAEVLDAQRGHRSGDGGDPAARMGALMGYPPCCVRAFAAQEDRGDNLQNERLTLRRAPAAPLHPLLNRLSHLRLVSHHPCVPDCAASIAVAEAALAQIAAISPEAADGVRAGMSVAVLVLDYDRRAWLAGAWDGDVFVVESVAPVGRTSGRWGSFDVRDLARLRLSPRGVSADLRDGRHLEIDAPGPILAVPGEPLAPSALAAISAPPREDPAPRRRAPLPPAIRPGVRVLGYHIAAVRSEGAGYGITLASPAHRFDLRVLEDDGGRHVLRRGPWAIDVEEPESLPDPARAALTMIARALPG